MYFQLKSNKIKTTKVVRKSKVGKGNETLMDLDDEDGSYILEVEQTEETSNTNGEISHVLEMEQTEETNNTNDEQVAQEPDLW